MSLNLVKSLERGENVSLNLSKGESLSEIKVGLGWDINSGDRDFDLDAVAVLLGANGKLHSTDTDSVLYYHNLNLLNGVAVHSGDNRTGQGDGDDETITLNLAQMPESVQKIQVLATIYDAQNRSQNFGQVGNAFARVYADGKKLTVENGEVDEIRYDLTEDYSTAYSVTIVEIYRNNGAWKVKSAGVGAKAELAQFLSNLA